GGEAPAVGAERQAADRGLMPLEGEPGSFHVPRAGRDVPDLYRLILARGGEEPAAGAEGHAKDSLGVAVEDQHLLPGGQVPNFDRGTAAGRGQELAVRAEVQTETRAADLPFTDGQRERRGMAQPFKVVPFPVAQLGGTLVEQLLGPAPVGD